MMPENKTESRKIPLVFYRSSAGAQPVLDWLKHLPAVDRKEVGRDLMRAQWRWPVGMPLCRPMGLGLWEVRSSLSGNRIARVLFCVHDGQIVALHGFIKKTQKTSPDDLDLAKKRMKEVTGS
jgi:phage-related protein